MRPASLTVSSCRSIIVALTLLATSSALAACSSDSEPASTESAATAATAETDPVAVAPTETTAAAPAFDPVAYCAASLALEIAPGPDIDFATATPEQMAAGMKTFATDSMLPLLENVAKVAPPELNSAVETFRNQLGKLAATGDPSVFDDPQLKTAGATAHAFDITTCKWNTVNVELLDYSFNGAPTSLPTGVVNIEVTNKGKEIHELAIFRRNDGVTQAFTDILKLPQEEAQKLISQAGGLQGTVEPSGSDYAVADLKPGTYAFVCFIPEGSASPDAMDKAAPDALPHAMLGMVHEFTVA